MRFVLMLFAMILKKDVRADKTIRKFGAEGGGQDD